MEIPETKYAITIDGVHIAYQVFGSGDVDMIYAPGTLSNVECVWELADRAGFLRHLASSFRVIQFDRRGTGVSDRPATTDSLSLEVGMDDIRAVMDAAGSERALMFGFEEGGTLCALYSASYPDRVAGLALFATNPTFRNKPDYPWAFSEEEAAEYYEHVERHWGSVEFWQWLWEGTDLDARALARYSRLTASPSTALALTRMRFDIDIRAVLPTIHVPTLIMHRSGDEDAVEGSRYVADRIPGARFVELEGDGHAPFVGDTDRVIHELEHFSSTIHAEEAAFDRVLATVLFTDIVGSTQMAVELGDRRWRDVAERHHTIVRAMLARYRGYEVDTAGDGFFATFDGPARAVRCAEAIIDAMTPISVEVRAGIHTGEVEKINDKVGGIAVSIGARVGALAGPREVFVSSTVKDLVAGSGLTFEDAGEHELKGVPDRWHLYRVVR